MLRFMGFFTELPLLGGALQFQGEGFYICAHMVVGMQDSLCSPFWNPAFVSQTENHYQFVPTSHEKAQG